MQMINIYDSSTDRPAVALLFCFLLVKEEAAATWRGCSERQVRHPS